MIKPNVLYLKENVVVGCDKHWLNGNYHTDTKENGCWNCQWKCAFYLRTGNNMSELNEETVGMLDDIMIEG